MDDSLKAQLLSGKDEANTYDGSAWNPTPEERAAKGVRPGAVFPGVPLVDSQAKDVPVDDDGIPFMSHGKLGEILGRKDSARLAWETGINQHIEFQGQGGGTNQGVLGKHRVWFSTRDVADHMASLRYGTHPATKGEDQQARELRWGHIHEDLKNRLLNADMANNNMRRNGQTPYDTHNQPDRRNAGFENRTFRGPRIATDRLTGATYNTNDLKSAFRENRFKPIKRITPVEIDRRYGSPRNIDWKAPE